jgi:hypothetical protein
LILSFLALGVTWQGAVAEKPKKVPTTDAEKLDAAIASCDIPALKSLISSGVDISVTDATGYDALSRASLMREERLYKQKVAWKLTCPAAVTSLTEAGADPWKAKFYQSPRLNENQPEMIAIISVEDNRENKGDSERLLQEMTHGVEIQLGGYSRVGSNRHLAYPILKLSEVRQKLRTSGFSEEDTVAPDRLKACKALGVDSVFESSLESYRSKNVGIASSAGMRMKFTLTDCKTGELLWRSDQDYTLATGWLIGASGGAKVQEIITGSVSGIPAVGFPLHVKK